ncbi:biotin--[acetyl-CoA-carboxylase] ligase [Deltaproteobacteria bacterium OttesenSCG-928-K17]|nr:biotin--[acetyl-CoA-carboxylase] ligase [Deltaproteobacteria bacterium OttesenSCG-928-K17]
MPDTSSTKDQVANLLAAKNDWVSGEKISDVLGISRAAVAKHVNALRREGFLIDAVSKRGYFLKIAPDPIDPKKIKAGLRSKIIGRGECIWLPETSSTNQEAVVRAVDGLAEGAVILSDRQLTGRGRRGRSWFSPPRSLCFSVLLRPAWPAARLPWLMIAGAAAVHRLVVESAGLPAAIKWPNDVLVNGRKMAGVLVEAGLSAGEVDWAVVGIGVNINTTAEEFPEDLAGRVTSLLVEGGRVFDRNKLYAGLLNNFDEFYRLLLAGRENILNDYWREASGLVGREMKIIASEGRVKGRAMGLNKDGHLLVTTADGRELLLESGDCQ